MLSADPRGGRARPRLRSSCRAEHLRPEHLLPEHLRPEHLLPEHLRPEHLRPEHLRPRSPRRGPADSPGAGVFTPRNWPTCLSRASPRGKQLLHASGMR